MQPDSFDRLEVLLLLGPMQLRGSSNRAMALADRLLGQRVTIKLVTTEPLKGTYQSLKKAEVRNPRHLTHPLIGALARRYLAADLRTSPPDLIDIQHRSLHPAGSWLARQLKRPYIVTVHDYLRDRERFVVDRDWCYRVIAVSESVRSELLSKTQLQEDQVIVIPTGVLPPAESELQKILEADRSPVIGTAGPLEAGKGLKHFLKAAAEVLKTHPQTLFLIAGSGPEERTLRRMASELGVAHAVSILPNLLDFDAALRAMDVFVLPALKQGLGSIMLEAMGRGLPVIATESGGVFSVVGEGATGLLVPPSDDHALAERMRFLLDNPEKARELGNAARQRVLEHFHLENMVTSTISLYREAVSHAGKPAAGK
ncbi:glycosyltransferase family 4 protein [Planctomicrobium sp. SH661]|uniref:glycosyltransferase family 4 protein n=1 Tax=Planctomicrobium sp. SH661 TaxID=3448124 RepID=UPI003F5BA090